MNFEQKQPCLFLDNIIFNIQKVGGISYVWSRLLDGVIRSGLNYRCLEYNTIDNIYRKQLPLPQNNIIHCRKILPYYTRIINPVIRHNTPFLFHSSFFRTSNSKQAVNITTVHDFTYRLLIPGIQSKIFQYMQENAIRKSEYIVCISHNTKNDLLRLIKGIDENRIRVIYNGITEDYFYLGKDCVTLNKYGDYAFFVGIRSFDYKNFKLAVKSLKNTKLNLVFVGTAVDKNEKSFLDNTLGRNRWFCLSNIANSDMNKLYNNAYCLLYLSKYEGFGLPVIEAQKAGCPVITLDAPAVVEIAGDNASLVASETSESIADKIRMLDNTAFRNAVIHNGFMNAEKYPVSRNVAEYLALYREIESSQFI